MQKKIIVISLAALMSFTFCACHTGASNDAQAKADSLKAAQPEVPKKNTDFIQPPDTDYSGDYTDRYKNGVIKFTGFFRFGKRHGQWMAFYINGEKWSECFYDKGLKHGASRVYFPNGVPQFTGWYKNDLKDSVWTFYDTLGKVTDVKYYRKDLEITNPNPHP